MISQGDAEPNRPPAPREITDWRDVPLAMVAFGATALHVETGLWRSSRPILDSSKCVSCCKCWLQCPDGCVRTDADKKVKSIDMFYCKGCGICARICPCGAIKMEPEADHAREEATGAHPGKAGGPLG